MTPQTRCAGSKPTSLNRSSISKVARHRRYEREPLVQGQEKQQVVRIPQVAWERLPEERRVRRVEGDERTTV
jgi:hypothetical protein